MAKTINKRQLHHIIKQIVVSIDDKTELAEYLDITPVQVYRRYSVGDNKRSIPEKYWYEVISYVKKDITEKKIGILESKKLIKQYCDLVR